MCGFEYRKEFLKTLVFFILLGEMITKDLRTEKNKKKKQKKMIAIFPTNPTDWKTCL